MRVFLAGEGRHDIGDLAIDPAFRRGAPGFLQPIVERLVGSDVSFEGRKITLLGKRRIRGVRKALERKSWMATLLAMNDGSDVLVFVTDLDREISGRVLVDIKRRSEEIRLGCEAHGADAIVCIPGIPCRTIEAWAMGDRDAVASVCGSSRRVKLPGGKRPEELWGDRRDPESDHPKMVLRRILGRKATQDDLRRIAERADLGTVRGECTLSFEPFASGLEEVAARLNRAT